MNVVIDDLNLGSWTLERDKNKKLFLKSTDGLGVIYNKGNAFQERLRELVPDEVVESVEVLAADSEVEPVKDQGSGLGRLFEGLWG